MKQLFLVLLIASAVTAQSNLPEAPILVYPEDSAQGLPQVTTLVWNRVIGAKAYELRTAVWDVNTWVASMRDTNVLDTTKTASFGKFTFKWYVRAKSSTGSGWGPYSKARTFTIGSPTGNSMNVSKTEWELKLDQNTIRIDSPEKGNISVYFIDANGKELSHYFFNSAAGEIITIPRSNLRTKAVCKVKSKGKIRILGML